MTSIQSPRIGLNGQANGFLSIGKAAEFLGVSVQSLRLWEQQGLISAYRTPGGYGQRRYRISELQEQVLGVKQGEVTQQKKVALYLRVSHKSQAAHLTRQRERLIEEVCKREGVEEEDLLIYEEIASSFGNRPALNKLVDAMLEDRVSKIYSEHHDRLSRVASLTRLIEHLARKNHVEIIALDREQDEDEMKANLSELIEFVHVISCRTISRRTAERRKKKLAPETVEFLKTHYDQGFGIKDTARLANSAGHRTTDGKPISYRVAHNYAVAMKLTSDSTRKDKAANHSSPDS